VEKVEDADAKRSSRPYRVRRAGQLSHRSPQTDPPLDRFNLAAPNSANNHHQQPFEAQIKVGGSGEPGTYLVICSLTPHFTADPVLGKMDGYVKVLK
jgi:hypothetical protein